MHDEKYISNEYLKRLAEDLHSNLHCKSIDLKTIIKIFKTIRYTLNRIIFINSGEINGEVRTAQALLTLNLSSSPESLPTILPTAMTGFILGCIQQNVDRIKYHFIRNQAPIPNETSAELRQTYLLLISDATLQLIKEMAMTLGALRKPQQSMATSLKPPSASILKHAPQHGSDLPQRDDNQSSSFTAH